MIDDFAVFILSHGRAGNVITASSLLRAGFDSFFVVVDDMYCCHKPFQIIGSVFDGDILEKKAQAPTDMNLCDIPCRLTGPNRFMASVEQYQADSSFI